MSHFYATIRGHRGEATRQGTARSGMYSNTAGWKGSISVYLWESSRAEHDDCPDRYTVSLVPWSSSGGESRVIAEGPLDANAPDFITRGAAMGSRDLDTLALLQKMVNDWPQEFFGEDMDGVGPALEGYIRTAKELINRFGE